MSVEQLPSAAQALDLSYKEFTLQIKLLFY